MPDPHHLRNVVKLSKHNHELRMDNVVAAKLKVKVRLHCGKRKQGPWPTKGLSDWQIAISRKVWILHCLIVNGALPTKLNVTKIFYIHFQDLNLRRPEGTKTKCLY